MLVGNPSSGKSPALDAVLEPMREIDAALGTVYQQERQDWSDKDEVARLVLAQWKQDAKAAMADGDTPPEKPG